jgi:hypothetical protein
MGRLSQGSPALRVNPGLSDQIPLGFRNGDGDDDCSVTDIHPGGIHGRSRALPRFEYPEGIESISPGLRGTRYSGNTGPPDHQP